MIEIAIVVLLAVVAIELGVILWAIARPLLALGRAAEAAASITEAVDTWVKRLTGPSATEEFIESVRRAHGRIT